MNYGKAMALALEHAAANPPRVDGLSTEDLHDAVEAISVFLKGPGVSALERLSLNEDRKVYRAEIARRSAA